MLNIGVYAKLSWSYNLYSLTLFYLVNLELSESVKNEAEGSKSKSRWCGVCLIQIKRELAM